MPDIIDLSERLRCLGRLTPSEAKIADFFQDAYQSLAFETPTSIGEKVRVSKSTVVRFISRLGYEGYSDFQENLRRELVQRLDSPIDRHYLTQIRNSKGPTDYLGLGINAVIKDLHEIHARNAPDLILAAARFLVRKKSALYVMGQHGSFGLAHHFWCRAVYLRQRVYLIDNQASVLPQQLVDMIKGDVLLAISHRGYSRDTDMLAHFFLERGGELILVTDREDAPLSAQAKQVLVAPTATMEMFESRMGSMMILQTLLAAMAALEGDKIYPRWRMAERSFQMLQSFLVKPNTRGRHKLKKESSNKVASARRNKETK